MLLATILQVAFRSIAANKLRAFLTMLGVIIGVAAVIAMLALGAGAREKITESVRTQGANLLIVRPGSRGGMAVRSANAQNLTIEDATAALNELENVSRVSPEVDGGRVQVKYFSRNNSYSISGVATTYFEARNTPLEKGRQFTDNDSQGLAKVAIIGAKVGDELFDTANPIGETIKVKGINFTIIGVLKRKGDGWNSPDERVLIPLDTCMTQIAGRNYLGTIAVQYNSSTDMETARAELTKLLRRQHKLSEGKEDDFFIFNLQEIQDQLNNIAALFTLLLGGVASISLLVGGIGIMNIMLVAVTERTREIGIRKALGARNKDVMIQFLLEAVVVSFVGGAIGVLAALCTVYGYNSYMSDRPDALIAIVQVWSIIVSVLFSIFIGVFFGFYPAYKAAQLNPIDALRYE